MDEYIDTATGLPITRGALALLWSAEVARHYGDITTYVHEHYAGDYDAALAAWVALEVEDGVYTPTPTYDTAILASTPVWGTTFTTPDGVTLTWTADMGSNGDEGYSA